VAARSKKAKTESDDEPVFVVVPIDGKRVLIAQAIPAIESAKLAAKVKGFRPTARSGVVAVNQAFIATGSAALVQLAGGTLTAGIKIPTPPPPPPAQLRRGR
jgi:hypothetical protein